jgi:hypothetical protein
LEVKFFDVSLVLVGPKGQFSFALRSSFGLFLFLLSLKVLDWVVCLDLYNLVFFSHLLEFFLESELYVFFQDLCFTFETPLKIKILKY